MTPDQAQKIARVQLCHRKTRHRVKPTGLEWWSCDCHRHAVGPARVVIYGKTKTYGVSHIWRSGALDPNWNVSS